jgi:hypothetical protein
VTYGVSHAAIYDVEPRHMAAAAAENMVQKPPLQRPLAH